MCASMITCIFSPQTICDVILEVVFPTSAMFLLADAIADYNTHNLSVLESGEAHLNFLNGVLLAGSMAEGLTMQIVWGHSAPDADMMVLLGSMFGVTIPHQVAPGSHHGPETTPPSPAKSIISFLDVITAFFSHSTAQMDLFDRVKHIVSLASTTDVSKLLPYLPILGALDDTAIKAFASLDDEFIRALKSLDEASIKSLALLLSTTNKSCLEYAPEGCPLAYTRLRGTNIKQLPPLYAECFEEEDGRHWLKTSFLNERLQQVYNLVVTYPGTPATPSGPAGQVLSPEK